VPCNSAAYFLADVRAGVSVPVLDPVVATAAAVRADQRPLVLGGAVTHGADLYGQRLAQRVRPTDAEQDEVIALIEALKQLDTSDAIVARLQALVAAGLARGADSVVLGCTEFGLVADRVTGAPVFNSNELLARQTVALARTPASGS
jgi:aspartate/glutamate racemase